MPTGVVIADYDPQWPELFRREREHIRQAIGERALRIQHARSTSVPGPGAKPVIDIILADAKTAVAAEIMTRAATLLS